VDGTDADEEVRRVREQLQRQWSKGEGPVAGEGQATAQEGLWALPELELGRDGLPHAGSVLLANPAAYVSNERRWAFDRPVAEVRTGLSPAPINASRRARADLPVVLLTRQSPMGSEGLLLNAFTGQLLGDLGYEEFMTRPLYYGGPLQVADNVLWMLHAYPELPGCLQLTMDGLAVSDDFDSACDWVQNGTGSSMRFKFFVSSVRWQPGEEGELAPESGIWLPARCSRELLLREPDSPFEEPLWVQIAERAGGELASLARAHSLLLN